jgi:hypothetical protein
MECLNMVDMMNSSPYGTLIVNGVPRSVSKKNASENTEAIVRIVAFPGLVVHKQGGGALAERLLEEEARAEKQREPPKDVETVYRMSMDAEPITIESGFRMHVLCKSVMHLMWGKQMLLTREADTSAHIDAMKYGKTQKYVHHRQGFIELYDCFLKNNPEAMKTLV